MSETGTRSSTGGGIAELDDASLLAALIDGWENEVVEFKRAGSDVKTSDSAEHVQSTTPARGSHPRG
ncbi:MAG: hypothetical protein U5K81_15040 [Trueperaceae bacterium]|nr:hypothetical protein [Trueperaceae bacterium]